MTSIGHSYGPTCSLYVESNTFTRRASSISDAPPKIRAQFFYASALPIDDPLSPLPPPSTSSSSTPSKVPPRPFSVRDNAALEEAWQGLQLSEGNDHPDKYRQEQMLAKRKEVREENTEQPEVITKDYPSDEKVHVESSNEVERKSGSLANIIKSLSKEKEKSQPSLGVSAGAGNLKEKEKSKLSNVETVSQLSSTISGTKDESNKQKEPHLLLCDDPDHIPSDTAIPINSEELTIAESESGLSRARSKRHRSPFHREVKVGQADDGNNSKSDKEQSPPQRKSTETQYGSSPSDRNTTGTPFLRAPSRRRRSISSARESGVSQTDGAAAGSEDDRSGRPLTRPMFRRFRSDQSESHDPDGGSRARSKSPNHNFLSRHKEKESRKAYVPVGISRLHLVEMPDLQMKPIYWSPVHDVSSVVRGTWFYKDTMLPAEPEVANQLEEGYTYNKPWTQTWQDELNSCVEAGAEGEVKAVHRLWPVYMLGMQASRLTTGRDSKVLSSKPPASSQLLATVAVSTAPENGAADFTATEADTDPPQKFANSGVIYVNARDAQILQPSLLPSLTRGRTPLAPIRKGRQIGIAVVRGFDYKAWEKLHPPKKSATASNAQEGAAISQSGVAATADRRMSCGACLIAEERPKVTDLVLVIHGIGQKLSERVESFHFTHSINAFRRQINVELGTGAIKTYLRDDLGGIMVLPINWRSTLTLQSGEEEGEDLADRQYTLKDITPESIPAVRNLISDVMLDIPYYLSHHKPKMIQAVIKEANRVYRLWCRNNPNFEQTGKVHLIAHSLGSVMALDILSKQPTKLPKQLALKGKKVHDNMFEFDTKSLFFCGSPAGFFLLLNKAILLPRKGREKADVDGDNIGGGVAGDAGTYGCLAVDNLYNIMHYNDPIAYRVNATVDTDYAASLQPASVPSLNFTFFQSIGNLFRGTGPSTTATTQAAAALNLDSNAKRPTVAKLPSTIEMETHNFTREEIAEKRMYLLNENGQIDYYLSSGGGPLEIQYLNMLGAHSSYWVLGDFVRLVVLEVGRRSGRENTLVAMRAVKRAYKK